MLDQSLLQSHFIGRDGFRWWIGQIPPVTTMGKQVEGGGWGNRFKVRILGYHPYSQVELPNEDLPWAQVLIPTTSGSGAANCATGVQLQPGDIVLGFFLDGDNAQIPVILATFGRTDQVPSTTYRSPFEAFTGYSSLVNKDSKLTPSETNEVKQNSQPSPQNISPEQAQQLSQEVGFKVISINEAIGDTVPLANTVQNTKIAAIKSVVTGLLNKIKRIAGEVQKIRQFISDAADKIVSICNEFVGSLMNGLIVQLKSLLKEGLKLLYKLVYAQVLAATGNPVAAHLAGVAAQEAMVIPVKLLEDSFQCIMGKVIDLLKDQVVNIITSVVDSVDRFVGCAADQFVGSLLNSVIGTLESLLDGPLGAVSNLLQFFSDFNPGNLMRSIIDGLSSAAGASFGCNQSLTDYTGMVNQWLIGGYAAFDGGNTFKNIQDVANIINSGVDPKSVLNCFSGALQIASPPTINIFGGVGKGAKAVPIFGNITTNSKGNLTASVIGAQITNPGSGYTFPPFVEVVDDNDQGYGAIGRSIINESGELTAIYFVSEGENYSVGNIEEYSIVDVIVDNGGNQYDENDTTVTDNRGNQYDIQIFNGKITKVTPQSSLNSVVDSLPVLTVQSDSGTGAVLRPILGLVGTSEFTGEVKTLIDCPI
jgi:hypothetical protein